KRSEDRDPERAGEREQPHEVAESRGTVAERTRDHGSENEQQRDLEQPGQNQLGRPGSGKGDPRWHHLRPPFRRACSMSVERRRTSSSESGFSLAPSSAAIADSMELPKKVRNRWRAAERFTCSGSPLGR